MENKIYLVKGDFGSWGMHHTRNLKAFNNKEKAEKYVEKANKILSNFSYHLEKMYRLEEERNKSFIDMTEEEIEIAYGEIEETPEYKNASVIYHCHWNLQEFNECKIEEIELI